MKESRNFELHSLSEDEEEENILAIWWLSGLVRTFMPLGVLFVMKTIEDEW